MSLFDEPLFIRPFYLPVWIAIRANESLLEQRMCQNRSMSGKSKRFDDRIVSAISASLRKDRDEGSATANRQVTRYRLQRVVSASSADVLCSLLEVSENECRVRTAEAESVVGCEKHHGLCDFIGRTEPAERNVVGNHLLALLARF